MDRHAPENPCSHSCEGCRRECNPASTSELSRSVFVRRLGLGAAALTALGITTPFGRLLSTRRALADSSTGGVLVGNTNDLDPDGAIHYTDPASGDPAVALQLPSSTWVAYDAVCTHAGCTVAYDSPDHILICPCHGSTYDPADHARVLVGPATDPLSELAIRVDSDGNVYALDEQPPTDTPTPTSTPTPKPKKKKTLKCRKGYKKVKAKNGKYICQKVKKKK